LFLILAKKHYKERVRGYGFGLKIKIKRLLKLERSKRFHVVREEK
jgi:hypothetical protein